MRTPLLLAAALSLFAGCVTTEPDPETPGCPAVACDLACERYARDAQGCEICACQDVPAECVTAADCEAGSAREGDGEAAPDFYPPCDGGWACVRGACTYECPGQGCYGDQDCPLGTRCNAAEVCLSPPGGADEPCNPAPDGSCTGGGAMPAVCYGECVAQEPCPAIACDLYCPFGYQSDENGCESCRCLDEQVCADGTTCPPGFRCAEDPAGLRQAQCEPVDCGCPRTWAPVCGGDAITYPNDCQASCAGVPVAHPGECEGGCACAEIYAPVCGFDGVTYGNECESRCAGVGVAYPGECQGACSCEATWAPVCGIDGNTYGNECQASCLGVPVAYAGRCDQGCFCPDVWAPVCGFDGNTYSNECEAGCAGVAVSSPGACDSGCACDMMYDPVCGADGRTYGNACEAACAGVEVAAPGECSCVCPDVWAPVCGTDGNTWSNACDAGCNGVGVAYEGECQPGCICPDIWDPVCGFDGRTYPNACEANCSGAGVQHPGECVQGCTPVMCELFCENGFEVGADGCPICACAGGGGGGCACLAVWDPVCGADGRTYGNDCEAGCAQTAVDHHGACGSFCGGIAGIGCPAGRWCELDQPAMPDSGGECVPEGFCRADSDCACATDALCSWEVQNPPCAGSYSCVQNGCTFVCN